MSSTIVSHPINTISKVGCVGVGYVGLELIQVLGRGFADTDTAVVGYDIYEPRAKYVDSITPDNVTASSDPDILKNCDCFMICVPTPDDESNRPDESCLRAAKAIVEKYARDGTVLILESSVCIGDTRAIFGDLREKNIFVAFSPERVDPGRTEPPAWVIPKLLGGIDPESMDAAYNVYSKVFDTVVKVSSPEVAEFSKLYENTFRLLNISFANQMSDAARKLGLDPKEIYDAIKTKPFGLTGPFMPGMAAGGPCLPSNALHLLHTCDVPILKMATDYNIERPREKAKEFNDFSVICDFEKVVVSGLAFKKNVTTTVASPALAFVKELSKMMRVTVHDPLVVREWLSELNFTTDLEKDLEEADCILLLVEHDHYDTEIVKKYSHKFVWSP